MADDVYLRPLTPVDIGPAYLAWFRDPEVTRYLEARDITADDALKHLDWGLKTGLRHMYAICDAAGGRHIGNLKVGDIRPKHGTSDLVTVIGERAYWGRGLATQAIRQGIALAFGRHGVRKLSAGMYAGNLGSLRAYTRAGFVVEAVEHAQLVFEGAPVDRIAVACFNPAFHPTWPAFPLDLRPYSQP